MRKILLTLVFIINIFILNTLNIYGLEEENIFSNEAIVYNLKTDDILFSKNTNDGSVPIASLTKIMTFILTVENIDDIENTKIIVPDGIRASINAQGGSLAWLDDGYEYTILDLLYGLMLPSGCDAADVLALYISNNDYSKFVNLMNEKAKELDMNDTVFYNATGLEQEGKYNVSTEQDLYKLAKYAINLPYFKEIIKTEFYTITGYKGQLSDSDTVQNTNYMMGEYNGAEYYYQYSLGGKTGSLEKAGKCLISFAKKGDLELVAITLGVPNKFENYHLTDHKKLFDYSFENYSENITIDINTEYKSVNIGEKIQITATTSAETEIYWESSDESIATVNEHGIVVGKKLGQVKITATTKTGNKDYSYVSVGFYNGIDIKYSSGPADINGKLGYGQIDWEIFKNSGIDFAIIRAGYASNNIPDSDPYFVENIKGAILNNIDIMISFDSYATDVNHAIEEAEFLNDFFNNNIKEYLNEINTPIIYNLTNSNANDFNNIILAFQSKMKEFGYDIIIEFEKNDISGIDFEQLNNLNIGYYYVWRPYVPDFNVNKCFDKGNVSYNSNIWQYRSDAYFGESGVAKGIKMAIMYMDYMNINTSHEKHIDSLYVDKNDIKIDEEYIFNGSFIEAKVLGYDSEKMSIDGNVEKNAGVYTITIKPKSKWKDGSKDAITLTWEIKKADPIVNLPLIEAYEGEILKNIILPEDFYWKNPNDIYKVGDNTTYTVLYIPKDKENYNKLELELFITENTKITLDNNDNDLNTATSMKDKDLNTDIFIEDKEKVNDEVNKVDKSVVEKELVKKNKNNNMIIFSIISILLVSLVTLAIYIRNKKK